MKNFWQQLHKPFFALAPMYNVTDSAFRQIIAKYGKPDVFFTEFVSADGLASEKGRAKVKRELYFTEAERPIVAQIFGANPATIKIAAQIIAEMGFDGLDINMGCPDRAVIKQGAGAALIKKPELALEIIEAAKEGAASAKLRRAEGSLPISIKTRIGYSKTDELEKWAKTLLSAKPAAITFHLRTMKEMSEPAAHWDLIKIPVALAKGTGTLILGNGDVASMDDGLAKAKKYGVDGIMIGRGIFGNPWFFAGRKDIIPKEKFKVLIEHSKLFEKLYCQTPTNKKLFGGHTKNFAVMKKHFKAYVNGFPGATELRAKLMMAENAKEAGQIVKKYLQTVIL